MLVMNFLHHRTILIPSPTSFALHKEAEEYKLNEKRKNIHFFRTNWEEKVYTGTKKYIQ